MLEEISEAQNTPKHTIKEEIYNEIRLLPGENSQRALEQVKILKEVPDNLVEMVYAHLQSEYDREIEYQNTHDDAHKIYFSDDLCIEGYVNEILANIQIRQSQPELRGTATPETREELDLYEAKILAVANYPKRFGLNWFTGRNPDVAWLDLDDQGRIIIKGVGEITTSPKLNKRKYLQLCESGFASNLRDVSRHLNNLEDGETRGLGEFGKGKKQLEVASKLKRYLVVHHDLDTTPEGIVGSIGRTISNKEYANLDKREQRKVFSESERNSFIGILNSPDTVIIKSVFSNKENEAITNYLIRKIQEQFPSYKFNNNNGR